MKTGVIVHTEAKQLSSVVQEFSRFAHKYDHYSMIQAKVATTLVEKLSYPNYKVVVDIGCGSGEVFKNFEKKNISVEQFIALDSAESMLDIHPSRAHISKVCANFNDESFLEALPQKKVDMIVSSSSLQWSTDLAFTMKKLSSLSDTFYGAVFTSGTFKTLHKTAKVDSPIYDAIKVQEIISRYYSDIHFELHHYSLDFISTRDMFKYIKQSGVSSGERKLNYKQTKELMKAYPLDYLEFEVLLIEAKN